MISSGDQTQFDHHLIQSIFLSFIVSSGESEEHTSTSILIEGDCMNWAGYPWGAIRGGSARKGLCGN
jgi:hypothetical protein